MLIKKSPEVRSSEITPKDIYLNRRRFLQRTAAGAALLAGAPLLSPAVSKAAQAAAKDAPKSAPPVPTASTAGRKLTGLVKSPFSTTEKMNSVDDITHYNNFYEFGTSKDEPATLARNFKTSPWTISVEGECAKPKTYDLDSIMKLAPLEERIYRHRCVEGWSIVVPWIGYSLNTIVKLAEPTSKAKYVAFQSFYDRKQMWSSEMAGIDFPYVEGLRMDEAMHPLALLSVGLYGETLPLQNGAPVRLVVPWKYGFKSIKSIIKIRFQEKEPPTTWNIAISNEYGFYSNVNPQVDHPRWSQASERRLGEIFKRKTLMFNGYGDQVASLYNGMDLRRYF